MKKGVFMSINNYNTTQLNKPNIVISNRTTRYVRNIAIALLAIAVLGAILTFACHGGIGIGAIGSDVMVFGGGAGVIAGVAYLGLRFVRDQLQKRKARKDWKTFDKTSLWNRQVSLRDGDTLKIPEIQLGKKKYTVEIIKGGKVTLRNK